MQIYGRQGRKLALPRSAPCVAWSCFSNGSTCGRIVCAGRLHPVCHPLQNPESRPLPRQGKMPRAVIRLPFYLVVARVSCRCYMAPYRVRNPCSCQQLRELVQSVSEVGSQSGLTVIRPQKDLSAECGYGDAILQICRAVACRRQQSWQEKNSSESCPQTQ